MYNILIRNQMQRFAIVVILSIFGWAYQLENHSNLLTTYFTYHKVYHIQFGNRPNYFLDNI